MADRMQYPESDPRHHTGKLKQMLSGIIDHAPHGRFPLSSSMDSKSRPCRVCLATYKP